MISAVWLSASTIPGLYLRVNSGMSSCLILLRRKRGLRLELSVIYDNPSSIEKFQNLTSPHMQQGTDDPTVSHRRNPLQTFRTASPEQIDQNGFCLIIAMMAGGNLPGAAGFRRLIEIPVPFLSADLLKRHPSAFLKHADVDRFTDTDDPHPGAETPDELLLPLRFCTPKAVIEVRRRQLQVIFG